MSQGNTSRENPLTGIASIIAPMLTIFALFSILVPANILQLLAPLIFGCLITIVLRYFGKITTFWAITTWSILTIAILVAYLWISWRVTSPAIITGHVMDNSGAPMVNLPLVLTDASGVDHRAFTDNSGFFEITNVLVGKYDLYTNKILLVNNSVPSGLSRIFTPDYYIGRVFLQPVIISSPSDTPEPPTLTFTPQPPTATDTSIAPTVTPTLTPEPPTPTYTLEPPAPTSTLEPPTPTDFPSLTPEPVLALTPIIITARRTINKRTGPGRDYPLVDNDPVMVLDETAEVCGRNSAGYDENEIWLKLCDVEAWVWRERVEGEGINSLPISLKPDITGDCEKAQITDPVAGSTISGTTVRVFWSPPNCPMKVVAYDLNTSTKLTETDNNTHSGYSFTITPTFRGGIEIQIFYHELHSDFPVATVEANR